MTDAELAVLSVVAEGPQHGYQIQQAIEARGVREWASIGFSSVYYILNKLERDGLLTSTLTPSERGPSRKVYELTKAGHGVLQTSIANLLSTPRDRDGGFILGLANLHLLRPDQVRHALDAYEGKLRSRIAEVNRHRSEQAGHPDRPLHVVALFDYSWRMLRAELKWLTEFRQAWEAQAPPASPNRSPQNAPAIDTEQTPPPSPTERLPRPEEETDTQE
jgi:DNA-binding PadR family transcriptional regulator